MITETGKEFNLSNYRQYSDTLIETGSAVGDGIQRALDAGFERIYSIELQQSYFQHCVKRFGNNKKVHMLNGKSSNMMVMLTSKLSKPVVYFLDAHPSGPGSAGHEELMREGTGSDFDQDIIIMNELSVITQGKHDDVIIIDDQQGVNHITLRYEKIINRYRNNYTFELFNKFGHKNAVLVCRPTRNG